MLYLAPRYAEVDEATFNSFREISLKYGGRETPMIAPVAHWLDDLCFVAGTLGAAPDLGDRLVLTRSGRLDGFTASGRFFVPYET